MSKFAVLLKGAHKLGATIQLDPSDIVASAPYRDSTEGIKFPDVLPVFKCDQVDNIIHSVGAADSLDGVAYIYIDHSEKGMPMKPNSGDIIWYPSAPAGKPA